MFLLVQLLRTSTKTTSCFQHNYDDTDFCARIHNVVSFFFCVGFFLFLLHLPKPVMTHIKLLKCFSFVFAFACNTTATTQVVCVKRGPYVLLLYVSRESFMNRGLLRN